jgi:hypothetical protein
MPSNGTSATAEAAAPTLADVGDTGQVVPDLSPVAIERLGLTVAELDRLGLDEAGLVVHTERAASALATLHRWQAEPCGWLGIDDGAKWLGVGAAARAECHAEAARHLADPQAAPEELAWARKWGAQAEAPEVDVPEMELVAAI